GVRAGVDRGVARGRISSTHLVDKAATRDDLHPTCAYRPQPVQTTVGTTRTYPAQGALARPGLPHLAEVFNRRFAHRRVSVGKSFVATVLRQSGAEVVRLRREYKHRMPRPIPCNRIWAMDLTGKADLSGRQRMILGVVDHGARACLRLSDL